MDRWFNSNRAHWLSKGVQENPSVCLFHCRDSQVFSVTVIFLNSNVTECVVRQLSLPVIAATPVAVFEFEDSFGQAAFPVQEKGLITFLITAVAFH